MIRAVLDPGVLVAAVLSPSGPPASILRAWLEGAFDLVVSPALLAETRRVFAYPKIIRYVSLEESEALLRTLVTGARNEEDPTDVPAVCRDPADDYLFALSIGASAMLVSGDADVLSVTDAGVRVLRPAVFARLIEEA